MRFSKAASLILFVVLIVPLPVLAKDMQADGQCQAGGTVGQACKDSTNGYTTSGHCTHIQVCAADNWPKAPKGCQPGQATGKDCPYGANQVYGPTPSTTTPTVISTLPDETPSTAASDIDNQFGVDPDAKPADDKTTTATAGPSTSNGSIFDMAFSGGGTLGVSAPASIVGSTSIDGLQYLLTSDNEQLVVGEPLTPAPVSPPIGLPAGSAFMLGPTAGSEQGASRAGNYTGYLPNSSFTGAPVNDGAGDTVGSFFHRIVDMIRGFIDDMIREVVSLTESPALTLDLSASIGERGLYPQAMTSTDIETVQLPWDARTSATIDIAQASDPQSSLLGGFVSWIDSVVQAVRKMFVHSS